MLAFVGAIMATLTMRPHQNEISAATEAPAIMPVRSDLSTSPSPPPAPSTTPSTVAPYRTSTWAAPTTAWTQPSTTHTYDPTTSTKLSATTTTTPPTTAAKQPSAVYAAPTTTAAPVYVPPTTAPAPPVTAPPTSGSDAAFLACVRQRESGGNYSVVSSAGYYGAYQFSIGTWNSTAAHAGRGDLVGVRPDHASPADQDAMALALLHWQGRGPWGGYC
jgi:hypothetical protein